MRQSPSFNVPARGALSGLTLLGALSLTPLSPCAAQPTEPRPQLQPNEPAELAEAPESSEAPADAQPAVAPPQVEMSCSPKQVKVGLPTLCTLSVQHEQSVSIKVGLPAGVEEGLVSPPQLQEDGRLLSRRAFSLRHLELDKPLRVKGVSVTWDHSAGQSGVVEVPAQRLEVVPSITSVLEPKPRTFREPLAKPAQEPEAQARARASYWAQHGPPPLIELNWALIISLGALLISAIGVGLGWLIRRWVEAVRRARQPVVDTRPAHVIALEAYELLLKRRLPEEGQSKQFYHELSEIIRSYLGRRFGLSGLEMTSDELRSAAAQAQLSTEQGLLIDQFLTDSDLVKFADYSPSMKAVDDVSALALQLIAATQERESSSAQEAPDSEGETRDTEMRQGVEPSATQEEER